MLECPACFFEVCWREGGFTIVDLKVDGREGFVVSNRTQYLVSSGVSKREDHVVEDE